MKKTTAKHRIKEALSVFRTELRYIFHDAGVILILFGAIVIYATAYGFAYKPEVVSNIPIAVIDQNKTVTSREFIRKLDATSHVAVAYKPNSLEEAKALFFERKVYGIVYIPYDFERNIETMDKAYFAYYADAGYFLLYKDVSLAVTAVMTDMNNEIEMQRFLLAGTPFEQAKAVSDPVKVTSLTLFNPYGGYGSFVMPAILVMILQQTLLIGIGMIGGTWREENLYRKLIPPDRKHMSALPIVFGKALAYFSVSILTMLYMFCFHYNVFEYPMNASVLQVIGFLLPYVLSIIFLGITLASLFRHRENSLIILLFTSIPLLMISGISVPKEAMPLWLYEFGKIFPSSAGINGFIRLQTVGASLKDVTPELLNLWILTGIYFLTACLGMRRLAREEYE